MEKQDLTIITREIIESLYNGMQISTVDPREYSTYNEREIALDYRDWVYALQEVELRANARERRMGYMGIAESIREKYKPQSFGEEVYYLADEFARPYNIFLRKDDPPYTSAIPENAKADRVIRHYQAFIYILFLDVKRRLVMMEPNVNKRKNVNKKNKNMIAKGKPTTDTMERGEEQFLYTKIFRYAKDIKKRLDMVNKLQDEEQKLEKKCNHLNWVLNKVNEESGEFVKLCGDLPYEEYSFLLESCGFEEEEMESLGSFVDMILNERKREEDDDYYSTWLQHKTGKHYKSLLVLYILVHKIELELKESSLLLESANYHPGKTKKERVGNIINMSNGGSYVDVYGNGNVTLNIATGMKSKPDSSEEIMSPEEQVPEVAQVEQEVQEQEEPEEELNLNAPIISLQQLLKQPWFAEVRNDDRYDEAWTDAFVEALMGSEYGEGIARDWAVTGGKEKKSQIKGHVVGTLRDAGVLKGSYIDIARKVGIKVKESNKENVKNKDPYNTFRDYMSRGKKEAYAEWVKAYVSANGFMG